VFKRYHSDKHRSEFLPTRWRQKSTGIDMEQNYVTVTPCIAELLNACVLFLQSHTQERVLITELCSEGSVYDLLCRPENFYGFPETQFVEFFFDFGK